MTNREPLTIIYEDQDLLILNKPAFWIVNKAETVKEPTVQDFLEQNVVCFDGKNSDWGGKLGAELIPADFEPTFGTPEEIFRQRSGIAHRIDKETSGILVVAKNAGSLVNLLAQFKNRTVHKKYLCLTHGKFAMPKGEINLPLGRRSKDRKLFGVVADGRPAVTDYEVKDFFSSLDDTALKDAGISLQTKRISLYQGFSLVECYPKTGRTHQIRVHMAHLQHALVGDKQYGGKKRAKIDILWCERHFLHANKIEFMHPRTGRVVNFEAPLSLDLEKVLTLLAK